MQRLGTSCFAIVFDFDQTLCSTKSGAAPVVGRHVLQPELQSLLPRQQAESDSSHEVTGGGERPKCCVATRNSHGRAIEDFLIASGVAVVRSGAGREAQSGAQGQQEDGAMPVHCVNAQGRTKADVALELLAEAPEHGVVVLVDDDLRELVPSPSDIRSIQQPVRFKLGGRLVLSACLNAETARPGRKRSQI